MRPAPLLAALLLLALGLLVFLVWGSSERPAGTVTTQAEPATDLARPGDGLADAGRIAEPGSAEAARAPMAAADATIAPARRPTLLLVRVWAQEAELPVDHVLVRVWNAAGTRVVSGQGMVTDEAGQAELEVEPDVPLVVRVTSRNREEPASFDVAPLAQGESREVLVRVATQDDERFCLRVLDRETLAPLAGAVVGTAEAWDRLDRAHAVETDAAGLVCMPFASWSRALLLVQAPDREPALLRPTADHPDAERALEVALSRNAQLRVRVLDRAGAAVEDALLVVETETYRFARPEGSYLSLGEDPAWSARTGADGRAVLVGLPPRTPLRAQVRSEGDVLWQPREPLVLQPGETRDVTWRAGLGSRVRGLVLEADGRPGAGIEIWLLPAEHDGDRYLESHMAEGRRIARSDERGAVTFEDVDAGAWWIGPRPDGPRFGPDRGVSADAIAPLGQHVVVPSDALETTVEIRLQRGLTIAGRVLDPGGAGHLAFVDARPAGGGALASGSSDGRTGEFVLGPLAAGEYVLGAHTSDELADAEPVPARAGATDVVLRLRVGAALRGAVVDASSRAPASAELVLQPRRPGRWTLWMGSTKSDGAFEYDGMDGGTYDLGATTADGRAGVLSGIVVGAGEAAEGLVLEVRPGARLRLRFLGPQPVAQFQVLSAGVPVCADGIEKGTERTLVVPAGAVVVRLSVGVTPLSETRLDLAAGETRAVTYEDGWR